MQLMSHGRHVGVGSSQMAFVPRDDIILSPHVWLMGEQLIAVGSTEGGRQMFKQREREKTKSSQITNYMLRAEI